MESQNCPSCGARLHTRSGGEWVCDHCGSVYHAEGVECPKCDAHNPSNARFCFKCGARLIRSCPACNHENRLDAEFCAACGTALDIVTVLKLRLQDRDGESARRREADASSIKSADAVYSEQIRRALEEKERERQAQLAVQREKARRQQVTLSIVMVVAGLLLIVIVVVGMLIAVKF